MDLGTDLFFLFVIFWTLTLWTLIKKPGQFFVRKRTQWLLDLFGLIQQGFLFPLIQVYGLFYLFKFLIPKMEGAFNLHWSLSFFIQFVLIDYLYYWNHRFLHSSCLWKFHRIHHSTQQLDLWATSRNSFWSSFFVLYLWSHSFVIYVLNDSKGFLWAMVIGNALDLWRHSGLRFNGNLESFFSQILIIPKDHEWHHSHHIQNTNFGANFNLWDKWHKTYYTNSEDCHDCGEEIKDSFWTQWLFPWRLKP